MEIVIGRKSKKPNAIKSVIVDDDFCLNGWSLEEKPSGHIVMSKTVNWKKDKKYLHRFIMNAPIGMEVDHINGNPLDNRKENLRICMRSQNSRNVRMHKDNKTGWKGVYCDKRKIINKWSSRILVNGKSISLGYYHCPTAAHFAYCRAAVKYHEDFHRLG